MKILLLGAPGSGKGTLSEYLIKKDFNHVSTGNIFRRVIDLNLEHSDELKSCITKGLLVPDDLTNAIVKNHLEELNKKNLSIVLDGYPRTIEQAKFLDTIFSLDKVIYLNVDSTILEKRLTGRRTCPECKKIYNIYFSPSKIENICDNDGKTLVMRSDDKEEVIKERMVTYNSLTFPLIEYYKNQNKLVELTINSNNDDTQKKVDIILNSII